MKQVSQFVKRIKRNKDKFANFFSVDERTIGKVSSLSTFLISQMEMTI